MKIYIHTENQEKADLMKGMLSRDGHTVITPFDIYPKKKVLRILLGCDVLYLLEEEETMKNLMLSLEGKIVWSS